jgi:hypothetical protein
MNAHRQQMQSAITRLPSRSGGFHPEPLTDPDVVGIELGRANVEVEGYHACPFGCEVGSHFHQHHVSRGPPASRVEVWRRVP